MGDTFIGLMLRNRVTHKEECLPISGFPCAVVLNSLHKGKFPSKVILRIANDNSNIE